MCEGEKDRKREVSKIHLLRERHYSDMKEFIYIQTKFSAKEREEIDKNYESVCCQDI